MLKKIIRLALTPLLVMGLTLSGVGMALAAPEEGLSDLQIREKLDEVNSRYEVGEEFSEEDASFVKEHAISLSKTSPQLMAQGHKTFSGSFGAVGGFRFIKYDTSPFGGSFNGLINVQTSDLSKRSSLGVEARITVYGIVGEKGLIKIFEKAYDEHENNVNYISREFADSYSGLGSFLHFNYRGFSDGNSFPMHED